MPMPCGRVTPEVCDTQSGEGVRPRQGRASVDVRAVLEHHGQIRKYSTDSLPRHDLRVGRRVDAHRALERVTEHVEAGRRRDVLRKRDHQFGVDDRDLRVHDGIEDGRLVTRLGVCHDRDLGHL